MGWWARWGLPYTNVLYLFQIIHIGRGYGLSWPKLLNSLIFKGKDGVVVMGVCKLTCTCPLFYGWGRKGCLQAIYRGGESDELYNKEGIKPIFATVL